MLITKTNYYHNQLERSCDVAIMNVRKTRKLIIMGLFGLAVGKYLNNRFELTSGAASFLETLFNYNDFEGLAFFYTIHC